MTWDVKWENYIGPMVGVSSVPLDYVTRCDIPVGWTAANKNDWLKHQAVQIGSAWTANKMTVYNDLNSCCLDGEGWLWIKAFDAHKDVQEATANLRAHYESASEVNKCVV